MVETGHGAPLIFFTLTFRSPPDCGDLVHLHHPVKASGQPRVLADHQQRGVMGGAVGKQKVKKGRWGINPRRVFFGRHSVFKPDNIRPGAVKLRGDPLPGTQRIRID